ncbi:MAG: peroxiredoxin-like family protein [Janthinobacterium lividum]
MKLDTAASMPINMQKAIDATITTLIAGGQAERAMKAGERAPAFRLPDSAGRIVRSADLLAAGPLVLAFYRGSWCSYCRLDLEALQASYKEIQSWGASLVVVSQQTPKQNRIAQLDLKIDFPMLSDKGGVLAELFGIRFALPSSVRPVFKALDVELPAMNGEASWTLPMPARYVIARDGKIAYSEINPDYTQRPEPDELFPILRRLTSSAAA